MSIAYPQGQKIAGLRDPCSSLIATLPYDRYNSTHSQINRRGIFRIPFWHNKMRKLYDFIFMCSQNMVMTNVLIKYDINDYLFHLNLITYTPLEYVTRFDPFTNVAIYVIHSWCTKL